MINVDTHFNVNTKLPITEFTQNKILIFAKFIGEPHKIPKYLITINLDFVMSVWDVNKLL